ncbi:MAG: response regulator [Bacteroidetes bacterium]|nr:response regulator [Deltaproteobacteria bacterium]MBT4527897.1 response regulator [Deltaproteobacteria bacterium]MBT7038447.1 response regulator [Bacteroidota bacterium]
MNKARILIVEDESIIALETQESLKTLGYEICAIVNSGAGAIKNIEEKQTDLILMDIHLKGDIDGIETAEIIQSNHHIPIIFLTAFSDERVLDRAKRTKPYGYLLKPFKKQDLKVAIEMALYIFKLEADRKKALDDLQKANEELESRVQRRTGELTKANKSKSKFVAQISHELRTPLHHILGFSGFGINKINKVSKDKLVYYFKRINETGNRMAILLDEILDLSKLEAGKMDYDMKKEDLMLITTHVTNEFQTSIEEKEINLEIINGNRNSLITADGIRLAQVIRNLLSNAIKFTPPRKRIVITIDQENQNKAAALSFSIQDEGIGIPENEINSIFEQYTQSSKTKNKTSSTGLGLAISNEIIKAHHGKLNAENNKTGGTTFSFKLPYQ